MLFERLLIHFTAGLIDIFIYEVNNLTITVPDGRKDSKALKQGLHRGAEALFTLLQRLLRLLALGDVYDSSWMADFP